MSGARLPTLNEMLEELDRIRDACHTSMLNQISPSFSDKEKAQFKGVEMLLSNTHNLVKHIRENPDQLPHSALQRYAYETLLLLSSKVKKNDVLVEVPIKERLDRYQRFLSKQKWVATGKYLCDIGFKIASALLTVITLGLGALLYIGLRDKVHDRTKDKSGLRAVNHLATLFQSSVKENYMPTPKPLPRF